MSLGGSETHFPEVSLCRAHSNNFVVMENIAFWTVVLVAGLVGAAILNHFSGESRERRKRRKNYGRVVARTKRPIIMLSAKTK